MKLFFTILLGITLGVSLFAGVQSHYHALCLNEKAQGAILTIDGVYCWRNLGRFNDYYSLKELQERHNKKDSLQQDPLHTKDL